MKDVWRCAGMRPGALCVMTSGLHLMHKWLADSWDTQRLVSENISTVSLIKLHDNTVCISKTNTNWLYKP